MSDACPQYREAPQNSHYISPRIGGWKFSDDIRTLPRVVGLASRTQSWLVNNCTYRF